MVGKLADSPSPRPHNVPKMNSGSVGSTKRTLSMETVDLSEQPAERKEYNKFLHPDLVTKLDVGIRLFC